MIAAAITRRLNVDPLIRTNGGAGGISATGTAGSNPHKISHYRTQLGCHTAFISLPLPAASSATSLGALSFTRRASWPRPVRPLFSHGLDSISGRPSGGRPFAIFFHDRPQHAQRALRYRWHSRRSWHSPAG